jgi:hypothetical protein
MELETAPITSTKLSSVDSGPVNFI